MAADESWAPIARATREALSWLGRPIQPKRLPGEPDPCGGTFAVHAMAHLATIKAICDHQLIHLGPAFTEGAGEVYWHVRHELDQLDKETGARS